MSVHSTCAVRPAQPCDCDAMADLARQLGYECTGEEARKRLSDMHDANHYTVFVAELVGGKSQAGSVRMYSAASKSADWSWTKIFALYGIGRMLIDAAKQWARRVPCHAISVRSNVKRDRAHRFYTNNGYKHVKTQKEFRKNL
jgi:GNAT superfamily N-acetyltransferase